MPKPVPSAPSANAASLSSFKLMTLPATGDTIDSGPDAFSGAFVSAVFSSL